MIRLATEKDIPAILEIYAPYVQNTTYTFEYTVPTEAEFTDRFRRITQQCPWAVWEENGKVLGYAYGSLPFERAAYAWCSELSVYLAPEAQGKGIGRKLYTFLERILQLQGYQVVYVLITSENAGSLAFHEKLGYRLTCEMPRCGFKHGRWLGVVWMEKRLAHVEQPTQMPVSWQAISHSDEKSWTL